MSSFLGRLRRKGRHSKQPDPTSLSLDDPSPTFSGGRLAFVEEEPVPSVMPVTVEKGKSDLGETAWDAAFRPMRRSKLSKSLPEVLADATALTHFLHFMHSIRMSCLVKFCLDAESFRVSAQTLSTRNGDIIPSDKDDSSVLRKMIEQDAGNIYEKYISDDATYTLGIPDVIRTRIKDAIASPDGVCPEAFLSAREWVMEVMERRFFPAFLDSADYARHQLDVLSSAGVQLADVLYAPAALSRLTEFLDAGGGRPYLEFWLTAESWREGLRAPQTPDPEQAQSDAMLLYDRYFSLQAPGGGLGLGPTLRRDLEHRICREGGPVSDCFDPALRAVYLHLQKNYFEQFLRSSSFEAYLKELVYTVQNTLVLPDPDRLRQGSRGSGCGSSVSSEAGGLSGRGGSRGSSVTLTGVAGSSELSLSSTDLYNSPSKKGLSLGRVNALGQYTSLVEEELPEERLGKKEKVSKAVKELLNTANPRDEAIATQVAGLIVSDILSTAAQAH